MTAAAEKTSSARLEWIAAVVVTVAVLWLHVRFWQNAGGLWRDEVNAVNLAGTHSLAMMTHDSFPVLVPWLLDVWSSFGLGGTDSNLRFAGMLLGLAIPIAFWTTARATRHPPLFSLVLFGLNALFIRHGDSLRAYGLGSALIVLAFAAMWWLLKNPSWFRALVLAVAAVAAVQALYQNAVLFFSICLAGFAVCVQRKDFSTATKIVCAGLVAAVSLLPYYSNFIGLPKASIVLRNGFSVPITSANYVAAAGFPFESYAAIWEMLGVIVIGVALVALTRRRRSGNGVDASLSLFAGATLAAAVVLFIAFLWLSAVSARPQYFLPPLAVVAVSFDCGLALPSLPRLARALAVAFLLGTALVAIPFANHDLRAPFTNVDRLATQVTAQSSPRDFVVVTPWFCGLTFARYFHAPAAWQTLPPLADHLTHRYDLVQNEMLDTNSLAPILEKISATLRSGNRVWVVGTLPAMRTNAMQPPALPPPPLPGSGWSDGPYSDSWAARVEFYLVRHGRRFGRLPDNGDETEGLQENLHLFMAEGWRD
jgi:hypothetical protein